MSTVYWSDEKTALLKSAFDSHPFRGADIARVLGMRDFHGSGTVIKALTRRNLITKTIDGYRFKNGTEPHADPQSNTVLESFAPTIIKVHGYYINPATILIVDTLQQDKVVIHTSILEIDGETKHPRNKRLIFTRQHAPDEYAAIMGWLASHSETPPVAPEDAQAALQLADEATTKLRDAQEEIKTLKHKLAQFRALLGDAS